MVTKPLNNNSQKIMKTLLKSILALSLGVLVLASCDRKEEFIGFFPYVVFDCSSVYTLSESDGSFTLPVRLMNPDGNPFSVTILTEDGTAVSGTHYYISDPETGVLNFAPGDTLKYVTVAVNYIDGYVEPGKVDFSLSLGQATGGVSLGAFRSVGVLINDADHPLSSLIGAWTAVCYDANSPAGSGGTKLEYTMNLSAVDGDVTKLSCDKISPIYDMLGGYLIQADPAICSVSEDRSTLTFDYGQEIIAFSAGNGGQCILGGGCSTTGSGGAGWYIGDSDVVFELQADGSYVNTTGYYFLNDYVWPGYGGFILGETDGYVTTWTKK